MLTFEKDCAQTCPKLYKTSVFPCTLILGIQIILGYNFIQTANSWQYDTGDSNTCKGP